MRRGALLALLVLLVLAAAGCGGDGERAAETAPAAETRPAAPAISGTTVDGEELSLAALRGEPVLVNVWSSW